MCPVCGEPVQQNHVADDGELLLVLMTPDGPAHIGCCSDRCLSCHRYVKSTETHNMWVFQCCGRTWAPVVSEQSLDSATATV